MIHPGHRFCVLLVLLFGCAGRNGAVVVASQPMLDEERAAISADLTSSRDAFLSSVRGLSNEQLYFKAAPERWSIMEIAEHVAVSEDALFGRIKDVIVGTVTPASVLAKVQPDAQRVRNVMEDRTKKRQASEAIRPTGRFSGFAAIENAFVTSRARTLEYVKTSADDFHAHAAEHAALGVLDANQWLLLVSAHSARHTAQILEVKADPLFPR